MRKTLAEPIADIDDNDALSTFIHSRIRWVPRRLRDKPNDSEMWSDIEKDTPRPPS